MVSVPRTPDPESRAPLSVLITARDEEQALGGALASVAGLAAEVVVVVDPRTVDRTGEIAGAAGARLFEHPFESSSAQLAWGLQRCAADWVFILDADERVGERLAAEMVATLGAPRHPAYRMPRRNVAFGKVLRFGDWGGDRVVRLVDRRRVSLAGGMHWRVDAPSIGNLRGALEHHTLRSLGQYLPKLRCYAEEGARQLAADGASAGVVTAVVRAAWRFLRAYVLRLGFLDGAPGLVAAILGAAGTYLKWALVWEAGRRPRLDR